MEEKPKYIAAVPGGISSFLAVKYLSMVVDSPSEFQIPFYRTSVSMLTRLHQIPGKPHTGKRKQNAKDDGNSSNHALPPQQINPKSIREMP